MIVWLIYDDLCSDRPTPDSADQGAVQAGAEARPGGSVGGGGRGKGGCVDVSKYIFQKENSDFQKND